MAAMAPLQKRLQRHATVLKVINTIWTAQKLRRRTDDAARDPYGSFRCLASLLQGSKARSIS
jgi:hypothetical protein